MLCDLWMHLMVSASKMIAGCVSIPLSIIPPPFVAGSFLLVVSFRRFKFALTEQSASLPLQFCLGGSSAGFHVKRISKQVFRFSVACKAVGLYVYSLRSFSSEAFSIDFHLWRDGGPNFWKEYRVWLSECDQEWTIVTHKKKPV